SGTVIERSVEPGQTVAASLSAPTLFIIAEDLSDMEIHVLVDESDIGRVKVGQEVRFTVDAYYGEEFWGEVRQIRLQPQTVSNVVNYTVVVDAPNEEGLLLPGMTATADFILQYREDVLLVPNSALRFTPTMEMYGELKEKMADRRPPAGAREGGGRSQDRARDGAGPSVDDAQAGTGKPSGDADDGSGEPAGRAGAPGGETSGSYGAPGHGTDSGAGEPAAREVGAGTGMNPMSRMMAAMGIDKEKGAVLWYLDDEDDLAVTAIEKGATDGIETEIARGPDVHEGMQIITAVVESEEGAGGSRNPLSGRFGRRGR
ncbi:MAG: HlyD family efflux transporter periplasmic adaptor subunit, partial [Candidatus Eisenbacteria bacterium]|nr:HlyD family efflux transporter periplasmic adaptor subunit [Candidatus Eisenbacteria bacterium]